MIKDVYIKIYILTKKLEKLNKTCKTKEIKICLGKTMNNLNDDQLSKLIPDINIFARTSPSQKE